MDFAAKLRDVEQQLSRVTEVVQLHVRLAAASRGSVEQESAVPELVESVERARRELNAATEELLALYKRSVGPEEEEADTETEDEFENNQEDSVKIEDPQVKSEILDLPDNKEAVKSSGVEITDTQEMKMEVDSTGLQDADSGKVESATSTPDGSSQVQQVVVDGGDEGILSRNLGFLKYTFFAQSAKKRKKVKNARMDAEFVLSRMSSQDIDKWRQHVRDYVPCVHYKVLAYLRNGKVARRQVELFSDATMLAVSLLITRDKCRDRYWLLQFAEELSDILHAAIIPPVVQMLGHVETSHRELVEYCISNFGDTLEDMSEYAGLVERHRLVEKKPMLPFLISLLRKFICDCVDYRLRQDANIGTPRSEIQWARFHEIGVILANWIDDVSTIDIPLEMISGATPTERLQKFNEQFPDRIPEALLVSWRCVSSAGQKMIGFKQGVQPADVAGTREGDTEIATQQRSTVLPFATPTTPFVWGKQLAKRKRRRSSCVETDTDSNKRIMLSQRAQRTSESGNCVGNGDVVNHDSGPVSGSDVNPSEVTHTTSQLTQSLPIKITQLDRYLLAAKEAEEGIKNVVEGEAANENPGTGDSAFSDTIVISKWTTAVKQFLHPAITEFIAKLAGGPVDAEVEAAFAEAIVLAVSLITTRENDKAFRRPWILKFVNLLDEISDMHEKQKRSSQALSSIHESRNALLVHCDNRFQDYLADIAQFVNKQEEKAKEEVGIDRLQEIINWLAIKFGGMCRFCILRHQVSGIKAWTDAQWQTFIRASWFLSNWTEIVLQASLPPPTWLGSLPETLEKFDTQFPGKLPEALLQLRTHFEESVVTAAPACKSSRKIVTKIKRIKTSDMPAVIAAATRWKMTKYLEKAGEVVQRWGGMNEDDSDSVAGSTLKTLLTNGHEANEQFLKYLSRGKSDMDANITFGQATERLGNLICRSPIKWLSLDSLKELLCDYESIIAASEERQDILQFVMPLTECYLRIENYCSKAVVKSDN